MMSFDVIKVDTISSDSSGPAPASASGVDGLIFFNVDRELSLNITRNLSKLHHVEFITDSDRFFAVLESNIESIDAVLLGTDIDDPVSAVQRMYSMDKRLPIVILSNAAQCAQLRRDLMFGPFLGYEVLVWPTTAIDDLADVLADAALRRQRRQRYQEAAIANAHVQLEVLPLLQPETAEYIEGLLDHQPIGVLATNPEGQVLTLNRQARQLLHVTEDDALERPLFRLFPKAEVLRLKSLLALAIRSNNRLSPEVFEFPTVDEKPCFIEVTVAAFSDPAGKRNVMLVLQDVTLRIQSEKQHTEAIIELRQVATVLRAFHAISTGSGDRPIDKIRSFLRLGCEQFGLPIGILSEIGDQNFKVLESVSNTPRIAPDSEFDLERTYCASTVDSVEPVAFEHARQTAWRNHAAYKENRFEAYMGVRIVVDGATFGTLCFMSRTPRTRPFTAAERETLKLMSQWIAGELQRERAEGHMRKLSSAVEQTADSVIITDCEGMVEYVNPSFEGLTGYSRDEVTGSPANFLNSENKVLENLWGAVGKGTDFRFQLTNQTKFGEAYHEQMTISPLKDNSGATTHLIATGQDVTALVEAKEKDRELQAELTHVARLSTLGGMVSGVAHELNQPLCAIMTYAQTCLRKLEPGNANLEDIRHGLNQVVRQAERADEIFVRIRNFSRKRDMRCRRVSIREIVESALSFVGTEIDRNRIKLALSFPKKARYVFADVTQIQQVLLNLVRNSMDVLADIDENRRNISIKVGAKGKRLTKITISDTGGGCPAQELDRLFEPFFTTKEEGLGVGLSISQAIIEAHGGELWLESTSAEGSAFCLTIQNFNET